MSIWFNAHLIISTSMSKYLDSLWVWTCRKHIVHLWIINLLWRGKHHQIYSNNLEFLFPDVYTLETPLVSTIHNITLHTLKDSLLSIFLLFSSILTREVSDIRKFMFKIRITFGCLENWELAPLSALRLLLLILISASCLILNRKYKISPGSPRPFTRTILSWQGEFLTLKLSLKNRLKSLNTQGPSTKWTPTYPTWEDW